MCVEFSECRSFDPTEELEQGTIIKFINNPPEKKYGIIVTGDCDIAQNKYGDYLSYCFIMPLEIYIKKYFLPKMINKKINKIKEKLFDQVQQNNSLPSLSMDALDHLINSDETALALIDNRNIQEQIKRIQEAKKLSVIDCAKELGLIDINNIPQAIEQFPGDKFYINSIPDPENKNRGFVINLRRISEIDRNSITTKILPSADFDCIAIGNLNSPYKQKMAQLLGAMFSDIGLPSEYEDERDICIENISKELFK